MKETRLADYAPPAFLVDHVDLDFDIREKETRVRASLKVRRNPSVRDKKAPLALDGEAQKLLGIKVNGKKLRSGEYELTSRSLVIKNIPGSALVEIESSNEPKKNTALSGLYAAGPMLVTQCEAEGFRRITFYPDRPDVLATFTATIRADKKRYPVLLANGNRVKSGMEGKGRHFVTWKDPFPKPCYLFALVAGKLDKVAEHYVTKSGRKVLLEIYVEPGKKKETGFAMDAVKKAMRWDEKTYGLEYDLDRFMIVAVSFFNMGAMENKGLNIFNDACVLGRSATATDNDIAYIERIVGHEYFHNWTGDRITCRDWFQLSLKEGLTVFREQEFCGDMDSRSLERLKTVWNLRRAQFAEDAGAMAHAIRPASYQAIDNFYTYTVYSKGSEVVRMIQTFVGRKGFHKGMDLYVKRHDGQAATCENFVNAMADANRIDLKQFMLWYSQAGTPVLDVSGRYDAKRKEYRLTVKQSCPPTPRQSKKAPMHMPFSVGLLDSKGRDLIGTRVLPLRKAQERFVFRNIPEKPVPSLLRDFSAPVRMNCSFTNGELLFLMAHDSDTFNRWEAAQKLFMKFLLADAPASPAFIDALRAVLRDKRLDAATKAMTLSLPSETEHGLALRAQKRLIDPAALYAARQRVLRSLAAGLADDLWSVFEKLESALDQKDSGGTARGKRSLKNLCLAYLAKDAAHDALPVAASLVAHSANMTDRMSGLAVLVDTTSALRVKMLAHFEKAYKDNPVIMDHWLSVQASARRPGVLADVKRLTKHPAFSLGNPNRARALLGAFATNPFGFHAADGSGYRFMSEMILKVDRLNPHTSAGLAKPFLRWRDFDVIRQKMMKAELTGLTKHKGLSVNCREVVEKSLKG
ncbi:MAG: aminopeptidase N [Alphaproteobacteria bacterium]|nr:aminopeptidase N [Alphaproteobacteria bacterium]